jgi:hypothetical protein
MILILKIFLDIFYAVAYDENKDKTRGGPTYANGIVNGIGCRRCHGIWNLAGISFQRPFS